MLAIGIVIGIPIGAAVFFMLGVIVGIDRTVTHEQLDIGPALRKSVKS